MNCSYRIYVLGQSHRPATDDAFASQRDSSGFLNLIAAQSTAFDDVVPGSCAQMLDERFEAHGVLFDKRAVKDGAWLAFLLCKHRFHDSAHRRHVSVTANG